MTYLIKIPHEEKDCLKALDEQLAKGSDVLEKFYFGCMAGDHTAYTIVNVGSEAEARKLVPISLLDRTVITEVKKLSPEMIRSFHTKAA
jgi:hypothetical protein